MRITYFYQYFTTPKGSYGTRVYEFTRNWVKEGHSVTVVTSVYAKSDIRAKRFVETQMCDGVVLKVINVSVDNKQSKAARIWSFLKYMTIASWYAMVLKTDYVICSSGPLTVGFPGLIAKFFRGKKLIFEVRDLWPEVAVELGIIKNKFLIQTSKLFERLMYKASSHIIVLSEGMKDDIKNRFGYDKITTVTNSANLDLFGIPSAKPDLKGLIPQKYALYNGNIGEVNNSIWLYNAAIELKYRGRADLKIVLAGDGQQREFLNKQAEEKGIDNLIFLGLVPKQQLVGIIQNSLVTLVPLKGARILDTSSPNKFFESLAAGIPVVQNTNGWMKEYLEKNEVGFTLPPDDPLSLADLLIRLDSEKDSLTLMGKRARILAVKEFDKDILAKRMLDAILKC